jgi:xanthine dehydrogenase YagR molybdenum-binding subunit
MLNCNWHDYRLPLATDTPQQIASVAIDVPDLAANTTGAKGLGEPVTVPTAAAIANAVFHATGVQMTDAPMTPGRVVERLAGSERS